MKKFNVTKVIAGFVLAAGLCLGVSGIAKAAPAAPSITVKNTYQSGDVTTGWNVSFPALDTDQEIYFNVYEQNDVRKSVSGSWHDYNLNETTQQYQNSYFEAWDTYTASGKGTKEFTIKNSMAPGSYNVVAYFYDGKAYKEAVKNYEEGKISTYPKQYDYISPASGAISIKCTGYTSVYTKVVKSSSIQLAFNANNGVTGYEVYRKEGSAFKKIATTTKATYTDTGLVSDTSYTYRVRGYYINEDTNTTTYGNYGQVQATTKGSGMNLHINFTGKGNKYLKLSWKKVAGASKYEIYRKVTESNSSTISKGEYVSFDTYKLVKTLKKNAKSYTDKSVKANETYAYIVRAVAKKGKSSKASYEVASWTSKNLSFGSPRIFRSYENGAGRYTVEWEKSYGATGYVLEKYDDINKEWIQVAKYGSDTTKLSVNPPTAQEKTYTDEDGDTYKSWHTTDEYRLYAVKGNAKSTSYESFQVDATLGMVSSVTAAKIENGVKVSWTAVPNASYYRVYRVRAGALTKDTDLNGYEMSGGTQVTEYVGATAPVPVDVNAYNAQYDAALAEYNKNGGEYPLICKAGKLSTSPDYHYYYQNYQYAQNTFTGTSMVDYAGEIYTGSDFANKKANAATGVEEVTAAYTKPGYVYKNSDPYVVGPKEGISYQYYVVAYLNSVYSKDAYVAEKVADSMKWAEENKGKYTYITDQYLIEERQKYTDQYTKQYNNDEYRETGVYVTTPGTTNATFTTAVHPYWKDTGIISTIGCKKIGSATYTATKAPGKATIKSVKSSKKKQVTLTIKKKVAGATSYKIYRSTKKKSGYTCVGTTTTLKFTDKGVKSGKKYYYKVVAVTANEAKADVNGKASSVKNVKVK